MNEEILWVEKYRPQHVVDCILPKEFKDLFRVYVEEEVIPNLLLCGGPGLGKTTVAKAMCKEVGCDYIVVNGSQETGIDLLRVKLENYCSSVSIQGGRKVVIIDEADYLNPTSTQPALRGFIERFANNCSFILTCNYANRIIEPIHSRCSVIEFRIGTSDKVKIAAQFMDRIKAILTDNNVQFEEKVVAEIIMKHFPDFRRVINELQKYSTSGTIDSGILKQIGEVNMKALVRALSDKKFQEVRKWVVDNADNDPKSVYRKVYDALNDYLKPQSIPTAILCLADYGYRSAFCADQEINLTACLLEIMVDCEFKE